MEFFLSKLNDREFESLCGDIMSKRLNLYVEKFKAGKDGGVDGRFWFGNKEGILQCKHYWKTGYKGLINKLEREEVAKVNKLQPNRYIFMTSVPLSRKNKSEIMNIFSPYIQSEADVWGEDDINTFLSYKDNQEIVERNYKLWITSTSVIDILLNNAIKGRSEYTINEIKSHNERYIITQNHQRGLSILKKNNVLIVTGEPGIGKTTLANNLTLFFIANGYEFCDIEESISEAESLFREREKKKIIFYCDDFLGSNMYDAISNKRDSHIVKFINRVKNDNTKKFILTSRTNIITKAISLSHQFQNSRIREDELLLTIENLTNIDKAKILYNHIYHSNLDISFIDEFYNQKRYKTIIKHRNFNPRIIEYITDANRISKVQPEHFWKYILNKLENPEEIWSDFFQNQVDDAVRILSFLTVFNGGTIFEKELSRSYSSFKKNNKVYFSDHSDPSFTAIRKLAIKSLLNRSQLFDNSFYYTLFNPSIGDFIINTYLDDIEIILSVLKSLGSKSSIQFIDNLFTNKKITKDYKQEIQLELFKYFYETKIKEKDFDFLILLSNLSKDNTKTKTFILNLIKEIVESDIVSGSRLFELLSILIEFHEEVELVKLAFLNDFVESKGLVDEDISKLLEFIKLYKIEDDSLISVINEAIKVYLIDALNEEKNNIDIGQYIQNNYGQEYLDFDIDYSGVKQELSSYYEEIVSNFDNEVFEIFGIDESEIIKNIDIDKMGEDYFENHFESDEDYRGNISPQVDQERDIDEIFER